jgi:hypothetical protein
VSFITDRLDNARSINEVFLNQQVIANEIKYFKALDPKQLSRVIVICLDKIDSNVDHKYLYKQWQNI